MTARGSSEFGLTNTNKLLRSYDGCDGLKTGSTSKALFCISATAERNGIRLISVIMAGPDGILGGEDRVSRGFGELAEESKVGAAIGDDIRRSPLARGMKKAVM